MIDQYGDILDVDDTVAIHVTGQGPDAVGAIHFHPVIVHESLGLEVAARAIEKDGLVGFPAGDIGLAQHEDLVGNDHVLVEASLDGVKADVVQEQGKQ